MRIRTLWEDTLMDMEYPSKHEMFEPYVWSNTDLVCVNMGIKDRSVQKENISSYAVFSIGWVKANIPELYDEIMIERMKAAL